MSLLHKFSFSKITIATVLFISQACPRDLNDLDDYNDDDRTLDK